MADFTFQTFYHCTSVDYQQFQIKGSKGDTYTVSLGPKTKTCTCKGFQYREHCRHIAEAQRNRQCGWMQFVHGGEPKVVDGKKVCPECGSDITSARWAV